MIPAQYATATAVVLALGGLLTCFAGYRLFRLVLAINGFLLGALVVTSLMGDASTWTLVVGGLAGGVVGAVVMVLAYFTGVGLIGAGLAALGLHLLWQFAGGDPPTWLLVLVSVLGALAALSVARLVVVFGTGLAGAWTLLLGAMALAGQTTAFQAALDGDVWVLYPLDPARGDAWLPLVLWVGLSLAGIIVQLATTSKLGRRRTLRKTVTA